MNIFELFYTSFAAIGALAVAVIVGHWIAYIIIRLFKLEHRK